ncbi:MAG TPA: site-specific integrase [Nitrospiraceae bacterium]|nr:site-specific integrase [Nitrospiraceae bacterium]
MTIGEFLVIYERNHVAFLKSRLGTSRRLQQYVGQLAAVELAALTRIQVMDWFLAIGKAKGGHAANHAVQDLHSMYVKASDWELYEGKNPAARMKKFPKNSRERFVQSHEMPWLLKSLADEMPSIETFFLCLLLTGARRDEARLMQWAHLDLDRVLWHKPTTKTGVPHTIPLPAQLVTRILQLPRQTDWVFPSSRNSKNGMQAGEWSVTAVEHRWRRIRRRVGLTDVRIHDLRRTAASWLAINGSNLPVIQSMLNHRSLTSTQVYARLSVEPVRLALDDQAERMLGPVPVPVVKVSDQMQDWPG